MFKLSVSQTEIDLRMKRFTKACRKAGAKLTHQRMEIFREVSRTGDHPDAETVFQRVRERMPTVSQDTVYRTLWWLKALGLVKTLGLPRERTRFDANLSRHHHFVCLQCGLTRNLKSDMLDHLELPESLQSLGYAEMTQVEIKGMCRRCTAHKNHVRNL